jgi:hypothetical protein
VLTDSDNAPSRHVAVRNGFKEVGVRDGRILHTLGAGDLVERMPATSAPSGGNKNAPRSIHLREDPGGSS